MQHGGAYLGICAGAYYAAALTVFEKDQSQEIIDAGELNFYAGVAEGPALGLGEFVYDSEVGSKAAVIQSGVLSEPLAAYYNGGCYFHGADDVEVLAYYESLAAKAAIIECNVGKNKAILSGVHIELMSEWEKLTPEVSLQLKTDDKRRVGFFRGILNRLNQSQARPTQSPADTES